MAPTEEQQSGLVTRLVATGLFAGYSPFAPGTAGTLVAVPLAPFIAMIAVASPFTYIVVLGLLVTCAIWAAEAMSESVGLKDPGVVVCDELVGYFVTMAFLPVGWGTLAAAFFWFRLFDVIKPPPARQLERLPGGYGIVLDDVMAGVYANAAVRLTLWAGMPIL
ncbi:MAG TPA: phosphatidylglycerophosphatase A [Candidatus Limnocylindrales bacterium]|nr:phosphatidylglycerophosphatase A [Candidatus Limnocylindrales bacterium]